MIKGKYSHIAFGGNIKIVTGVLIDLEDVGSNVHVAREKQWIRH
jgi:hypothetical protein